MMDYPRAFFVFDKQAVLPRAEFFQKIASSDCETYIPNFSEEIEELELQIAVVQEVNSYFLRKLNYVKKDTIVISNPKTLDFLMTYFSDKNLAVYWIDNAFDQTKISRLIEAIVALEEMKINIEDACNSYDSALESFFDLTKRAPHPRDEIIRNMSQHTIWKSKTYLECEIEVLLKNTLKYGIINRVDLSQLLGTHHRSQF
jgi:hypothetical protein